MRSVLQVLLCASLLLAGGAHACAVASGSRKLLQSIVTPTNYGKSLSDCVANAGLKSTAALIAAAETKVTDLFTNGDLSLTFFAPDDQTWGRIAKNAGTTVTALINRPGFPEYFLKNHLLNAPRLTSYWPAPFVAGKYLPALDGTQLQLWTDGQYTNRVMGLFNTKTRLACIKSNLKCGNSIMHVIVDPEIPTQ